MMIPMKAIFIYSFIFLYAHILRDMQLCMYMFQELLLESYFH
jgi:hypothetical protein